MPPKLNIKLQWQLLLFKNWNQHKHNWMKLLWILIIPIVIHSYLIVELLAEGEENVPEISYEAIDLNMKLYNTGPDRPKMVIYGPDKPFFGKILERVQYAIGITYRVAENETIVEEVTGGDQEKYMAGVMFNKKILFSRYLTELDIIMRFPAELRNNKDMTWNTNHLLPYSIVALGSRNKDDQDGGAPVGYAAEGFLQLQNSIAMEFLRAATGFNSIPDIKLQRFPYPSYIHQPMCTSSSSSLLPTYLLISFLYPSMYITYMITKEKTRGLKEMIKLDGIESFVHFAAWFVTGFLILGVVVIELTILYKVPLNSSFFPNSGWLWIYIFLTTYTLALISFAIMVSAFFDHPRPAVYFFLAIYLFSNLLLRVVYDDLTMNEKLGYCMLMNSAMNIGCLIMRRLECSGFGLTGGTLFDPATLSDNLPLGIVMMIFLAESLVYFLIALYVDQINPGIYGVRRKWYFPFTAQFLCNRKETLAYDERLQHRKQQRPTYFEDDSHKKRPILEVKNLTRILGRSVVVKNVSFNLYASEIVVLLGPAGAGKSTLISLIAGQLMPHLGTALILGKDIRQPSLEASRHLGISFGDRVLWDNLTAEEHLKFYSKLRSINGNYSEEEVDRYMELMQLGDDAEVATSGLKLGAKRKIMICNALCGNVNVLICKDPTSGLDPDSRLEVWNMLKAVKRGRGVLVTTESIYEAEMLSDRIAIMCDGELKCLGTKFFLKKLYGSGHRLICHKKENCDVHLVSDVLRNFIPTVRPIKNSDKEIIYNLPDRLLPQFSEMLSAVENELDELNLAGITIVTASMEEVYMSAGGDSYYEDNSSKTKRSTLGSQIEAAPLFVSFMRRAKGCKLICKQWEAMFLKKMLFTYRGKIIFFLQIFLPAIVLICRFYFYGGAYNPFEIPSMTFGLDQYEKSKTLLVIDHSVNNDSFENELVKQYENLNKGKKYHEFEKLEVGTDLNEHLLELGKTMQPQVEQTHLVACEIKKGNIIAWMNNQALHTAPLSLNLIHNAMAKVLLGEKAQITVTSHPLPITARMAQKRIDQHSNVIQNYLLAQVIVLALYVLYPNRENVSNSKELQFTCGVRVWIYWLSHLLWDLITVTISTFLFTITMALTEKYSLSKELASLFPITLAFGFCVLCLTYLLSFIFQRETTAFGVLVFFYYVGKLLFQNMIITYNWQEEYFYWFPFTAYAKACDNIQLVSIMERDCKGKIAEIDEKGNCALSQICCVKRDLLAWQDPGILTHSVWLLAEGVFFFIIVILTDYQVFHRFFGCIKRKIKPVKKGEKEKSADQGKAKSKSFFAGLCRARAERKLREHNQKKQQFKQLRKKLNTYDSPDPIDDAPIEDDNDIILYEDEDVLLEKKTIKALRPTDRYKRSLIADGVTKIYGQFIAIDDVSFQARKRECFGISGIRGCGKSTLLKMLVSQTARTSGNIYIRGRPAPYHPDSSKKNIGYCPQKDAFFLRLTGRENLKIFLLCRGIEINNLNQFANELACTFHLTSIMDLKSQFYNRGSRRKLSMAIAVIGPPSVLILDEPTTNIDPTSKQRIWEVINKLRESSKSVLITTKNMDECETLCTRMAIMVNGQFMCMGSKLHLRDKYSQGFILTIKFKSETDNVEATSSLSPELSLTSTASHVPVKDIEEFVQRKFPEAKLRQRLPGYRIYYVPNNDMKWSEIFGTVEKYRKALRIQDYSISQKSLEEIYLDFSKYQKHKGKNL